jgi:ABC-2 type transport system permease protein
MSASGATPNGYTAATASGPGGDIYDLGYQRYVGPRLGRPAAVSALFWHTVRSTFGIGRGGRAKIAPFTLAGFALLPAVLAVGITAIASQAGDAGEILDESSPIQYGTYHSIVATLVMLFCAAQAPELLGRDQRYGVLPIYFSRALERVDYALAKAGGLVAGLLVLTLLPQLILLVGRILAAPDPATGAGKELPNLPPILIQGVLAAGLLGAVAMVIAAFTPRRAYATAAIIAVFIIPPVIAALIQRLGAGDVARFLVFLRPGDVLDGSNAFLFDTLAEGRAVRSSDLPPIAYPLAALLGTVGALGVTVRRYLRIGV